MFEIKLNHDKHHLTDAQLLMLISSKNKSHSEAEKAFVAFCKRHHAFINLVCKQSVSRLSRYYGDDVRKNLYHNTIIALWESAAQQILEAAKSPGQEMSDELVRTELSKLIRQQRSEMIKEHAHSRMLIYWDGLTLQREQDLADLQDFNDGNDHENDEIDGKPANTASDREIMWKQITQLRKILMTFKKRDRDIILTLLEHSEYRRKTPRHVISDLCQRWSVNQAHIRSIKSRTIAKLRVALKAPNTVRHEKAKSRKRRR